MNIDLSSVPQDKDLKAPHITVVRLTTETYKRGSGYYFARRIQRIERLSTRGGFCLLAEEVSGIGVDGLFHSINNLDQCKDGIYVLAACNFSRDWESGHIDGYELELVKFEQ